MADGYEIRREEEFETVEGSGGAKWELARRALKVGCFGMNIVEIPGGSAIVEHDETTSGQVEVYAIMEGEGVLVVDGEEHPAPAGTWARFDPQVKRNVLNRSDAPLRALLIGVPADTTYEPMDWA